MTTRERTARMAGFVVTLLPLSPAQADARQVAIFPHTVTTVVRTHTTRGFRAVGGVLEWAPDHAPAEARLELVGRGS